MVRGRLNVYSRHLIRGSRILGIPVLVTAVLLTTAAPAFAAKPLDTLIDSGPSALTNGTTATFTFHSSGQSPTYVCSLDGAPATACSSPKSYASLGAGPHTFTVASSAGGQTDTSPATSTWTVDLSPPSPPTMLTPTTPTPTSVALSWKVGTDNIGVTNNVILRDGTVLTTVGKGTSYTDSSVTTGSTHTYAVMAQDGAGNLSPTSNTVTATTPSASTIDTTITSGPVALTNSTSASFSFSATVPGPTFTCQLDAGNPTSCTSPTTYRGLASGNHTFSICASLGGVSDPTPATASWTVDTGVPSTPANLSASASSASVSLTWAASTDNIGVTGYDVFRGGSLLASAGAATAYTDSTVSDGSTYTYSVRARDGAGNTSALSDPATAVPKFPYDPSLTRAPYLTDLVNLHVAINWATNQSATTGSVQWGQVGAGGACLLTNTLPASRMSILVGTVPEYQWKGDLTLPASGKYCYRVYLGNTDLLGANPSPSFTTQIPFGSTQSFSFDVFGDWGQTDTNGQNQSQANLQAQIANSGASFAVTVGDNGQPTGSQINYGDLQQKGSGASAIFGPSFWTIPGAMTPLFTAPGNHGLSGVKHTDITTWTQSTAVSTSNGRYQNDLYPSVNGSTATNYGSEWYAFTAGNVRFYILDAAWGDTNAGTATPYANDALAHFSPGAPEYTWLLNDLQTHPTQLKFAFFHYPLYSDNPNQPSDTYLDGATNLEGLLGQHGVQLVFNGHAHMYERNRASAAGMPITYVTGGGGATLVPIGPCQTYDAYGIGWSPTKLLGTACGAAKVPSSEAQVRHFLKVTVSGTSVTVAPTDSTGHTFDVQTYTFKVPTDTYVDSAPPAGTTSSNATFTFHASGSPATYKCKLDNGTSATCASPVSYSGLAQGSHTFSVAATVNGSIDPTPALATWTIDNTPPAPPAGLTATAISPFMVNLTWAAATDNTGVTGYDIYRDGTLYQTIGAMTSWADPVLGGSAHTYAVDARDIAGNVSPRTSEVSVSTPPPPAPVFSDGFESGTFNNWNTHSGLDVETATTHTGTHAVEGNTIAGGTYAKKTLPGTYPDAYARVWFDVVAQSSQVNLLRLRDASGQSLGYVYIEDTGQLGYHNDALGTNALSDVSPSPGWHVIEVRLSVDSTAGVVQLWLDNSPVSDLSSQSINTGSAPVAALQIGEVQTGLTYDVAFDDVAFGTSRLGPEPDTNPPSVPTGVTADATSAFSVQLGWTAATDNVGVSGYDLFRNGSLLAGFPADATSYTDSGVLAGQDYAYTVRARDVSGNVSAQSETVSVTTPAAAAPLFADGFETGDLSAWTTTSGLTVQGADVNAGAYAADGNPTSGPAFAKATLPSSYNDVYARVAFNVHSQGAQMVLLRLRNTPTGTGGYVYLSAGGYLGFHNDATGTSTTTVRPSPGWHTLELHLNVTAGTVEVWLDGATVSGLNQTGLNLGAKPIGVLQIGDTSNGTWNVAFDNAALGTSRLGPS
jgi:fibronectin type 3 domain-containing protein